MLWGSYRKGYPLKLEYRMLSQTNSQIIKLYKIGIALTDWPYRVSRDQLHIKHRLSRALQILREYSTRWYRSIRRHNSLAYDMILRSLWQLLRFHLLLSYHPVLCWFGQCFRIFLVFLNVRFQLEVLLIGLILCLEGDCWFLQLYLLILYFQYQVLLFCFLGWSSWFLSNFKIVRYQLILDMVQKLLFYLCLKWRFGLPNEWNR